VGSRFNGTTFCHSIVLVLPNNDGFAITKLPIWLLRLERYIDEGLVFLVPETATSNFTIDAWRSEFMKRQESGWRPWNDDTYHMTREILLAETLDACVAFPNDVGLALVEPHERQSVLNWLA
jgi:hypothetical protein